MEESWGPWLTVPAGDPANCQHQLPARSKPPGHSTQSSPQTPTAPATSRERRSHFTQLRSTTELGLLRPEVREALTRLVEARVVDGQIQESLHQCNFQAGL